MGGKHEVWVYVKVDNNYFHQDVYRGDWFAIALFYFIVSKIKYPNYVKWEWR